jgi:phosphoserine phosphatase
MPSWNESPIKKKVIDLVEAVTNSASKDYVAPEDRIATFDNDGTLWVEQPMYVQVVFSYVRFKEIAVQHPEWKDDPVIKPLLTKEMKDLTGHDLETIIVLANSDVSIEEFQTVAKKWLATAEDSRFKQHYTQLVYQPMLEVINYLHAKHFKVYIVSGGGQDFIRAFAGSTYQVPKENVIGTALHTEYSFKNNIATLILIPKILFMSNNEGKVEAINLFIAKKPIIAFGNSDGDRQMLEWTQSNKYRHLMLLVHHDDGKREYAYDTETKVGTFSASLMKEAEVSQWQVISMKNDWKVIFPFSVTE